MGINKTSFLRGIVWIVFLLGFGCLLRLGFWQLSRMTEKKAIERAWAAGQKAAPVSLLSLLSEKISPQPHQPVLMPPVFFLQPVFLLDNQVQNHQPGYKAFYVAMVKRELSPDIPAFLIEGPWIPYKSLENPDFLNLNAGQSVPMDELGVAYIQFPSRGLQLRAQAFEIPIKWPLVLQWIDPGEIGQLIDQTMAPFWIKFEKPKLPNLSPEKHLGYAVQWFLFSGLWAGYGIFVFCRRQKKEEFL